MQVLGMMLAVAIGGAIGALARYGIGEAVRHWSHWPPYVSTLLVNVAGCLGIGIVFALLSDASGPEWRRLALVTGLLGAFTTFSTFSLDAMTLIHDARYGQLLLYVVGSVLLGVVAVKAGMHLVSALPS